DSRFGVVTCWLFNALTLRYLSSPTVFAESGKTSSHQCFPAPLTVNLSHFSSCSS
ncbi:hypothetical protein GOODEAATRI_010312, partial [Goodea atripinnis]